MSKASVVGLAKMGNAKLDGPALRHFNKQMLIHGLIRGSLVELGKDVWGNEACLHGVGFKSGLPLFLYYLLIKQRNDLRSTACKAVYGAERGPVQFRPQPPFLYTSTNLYCIIRPLTK